MRRALGHARAMNELQRQGSRVAVDCAANCLQCDGQNDNAWDQGMLFLNPSKVWPQPPYYVTQMIARNWAPKVVRAEAESPGNALDVTAKLSDDGHVLVLQVVNMEEKPCPARIALDGFTPTKPVAKVWELCGKPADRNTAAEPDLVKPKESEWRHAAGRYEFAPYSFTVLRFE
jgi:alpha-L-arabinofuranosidase